MLEGADPERSKLDSTHDEVQAAVNFDKDGRGEDVSGAGGEFVDQPARHCPSAVRHVLHGFEEVAFVDVKLQLDERILVLAIQMILMSETRRDRLELAFSQMAEVVLLDETLLGRTNQSPSVLSIRKRSSGQVAMANLRSTAHGTSTCW